MLDPEHPLRVTTDKWREKIRLGKKFKKDHFDKYAEEGMDFYTGYDPIKTWDKWMVNPENGGNIAEDSEAPDVTFKFMSAWVADLVSLYGPMLYHRNPTRFSSRPSRRPAILKSTSNSSSKDSSRFSNSNSRPR
jgi:hypothetical protein